MDLSPGNFPCPPPNRGQDTALDRPAHRQPGRQQRPRHDQRIFSVSSAGADRVVQAVSGVILQPTTIPVNNSQVQQEAGETDVSRRDARICSTCRSLWKTKGQGVVRSK